jgi:hypothetical protein
VIGADGALIERRRQSGGTQLAEGRECSIAFTLLPHSVWACRRWRGFTTERCGSSVDCAW